MSFFFVLAVKISGCVSLEHYLLCNSYCCFIKLYPPLTLLHIEDSYFCFCSHLVAKQQPTV